MNILIVTLPADGHFNPLTGLAKYLQEAGCDVRWYTSVIFRQRLDRLNIAHYPFIFATDVNSTNINELFPERKLIVHVGERANFDMINGLCKPAPGNLRDIRSIQETFPFDVIITESGHPAIPLLKAKLNVPVIAIGVIPLTEESKDLGPYGLGLYPPKNDDEVRAYAEMKRIFNEVVFKGAIDTYSAILVKNNVPHKRAPILDIFIKHADLCLQIGTPSFEYKRSDLGRNIRFIGALLPFVDPERGRRWADDRLKRYKKIVLVTQGTVETDTQKLIEPTLEAFAGTDTLVIATTGGHSTAELRKKYPCDNMIIEDYIPFEDVMPYASVYVTNGGYSGTLLSIRHKLPMVAAGLYEGKSEICSRIGYFNLGINLKTEMPAAESVRAAVELVLSDGFYKQNVIRLAEEMSYYNAKELVAHYIVELLDAERAN